MREKIRRAQGDSIRRELELSPVEWIETHFYIPETNAPIELLPYQKAVIREALRKDGNGLYIYSTILYSDLKKSAKSTIAGAVALYLAYHSEWETVRIVANDLKQADSRTFYYIERAIMLNPKLKAACKINRYEITLPNHTTISAIAVDPKGEAGGGDLVTCFTELWAYKNDAAKQLWVETALSPLKFGKSLRWCETYAGYVGESPILEQLYEIGVKQGIPIDVGIEGLELTAYPEGRMLALWNTQPRCPWQSPDYYRTEATQYVPQEFNRIHRNQWAKSTDRFVPDEWWEACAVDTLPALSPLQPIVIALDAGVSSDNFAIVAVSRRDLIVEVRSVNVFVPPVDGKFDFADAEASIKALVKLYSVVCVVYDPYQLHDMATRLTKELGIWFEPFPQGVQRLVADKQLRDNIMNQQIVYQKDTCTALTEHIRNANAKTEGDKLRLVKREETKKIDAAVDLSMANYQARFLNIG